MSWIVLKHNLKHLFPIVSSNSEEEAINAVGFYREYFKEKGLYENEIYEGFETLLKE